MRLAHALDNEHQARFSILVAQRLRFRKAKIVARCAEEVCSGNVVRDVAAPKENPAGAGPLSTPLAGALLLRIVLLTGLIVLPALLATLAWVLRLLNRASDSGRPAAGRLGRPGSADHLGSGSLCASPWVPPDSATTAAAQPQAQQQQQQQQPSSNSRSKTNPKNKGVAVMRATRQS